MDMFLPEGFPDSVSADYLEYQIWDTLQGFLGYLRNIILSMAYLKGMGIGAHNIESTLIGAMYITIVRDTTSVVAGLASGIPYLTKTFSDRKNLKKWRMVSEMLRVLAGFIQIYAAYYSVGSVFVFQQIVIVSLQTSASVMEVQTRSSLITHFAKRNNIADCAAKEGNQDRGIKVFGIPLAIILIRNVNDSLVVLWTTYGIIVILQMLFNVLAVKALKI